MHSRPLCALSLFSFALAGQSVAAGSACIGFDGNATVGIHDLGGGLKMEISTEPFHDAAGTPLAGGTDAVLPSDCGSTGYAWRLKQRNLRFTILGADQKIALVRITYCDGTGESTENLAVDAAAPPFYRGEISQLAVMPAALPSSSGNPALAMVRTTAIGRAGRGDVLVTEANGTLQTVLVGSDGPEFYVGEICINSLAN
jgi:hypothetical protein